MVHSSLEGLEEQGLSEPQEEKGAHIRPDSDPDMFRKMSVFFMFCLLFGKVIRSVL